MRGTGEGCLTRDEMSTKRLDGNFLFLFEETGPKVDDLIDHLKGHPNNF